MRKMLVISKLFDPREIEWKHATLKELGENEYNKTA